jgi:phosphatidylglycerol---prolipoprotein diacylglyceryl transferase
MLLNYLEPSLHLGPLTVHLYGLFLAVALLAGLRLALYRAAEKKVPGDLVWELSVYTIIGAVAGARIFSVALNYERFLVDPLYLFRIHEGGLAYFGGLAGGALAAYWLLRRRRIGFWKAADVFTPSLALGEAITRLGCDVYGIASAAAPWPRIVEGIPHHNIPLYMVVSSLLLFALLWYLRNRVRKGQLFLIYLAGYFTIRTFVDFFRDEAVSGLLNGAQITALALLGAALLGLYVRRKAGVSLNRD